MNQKRHVNDNSVVAMKNDVIPSVADLSVTQSRLFQYILAHYDSRGSDNPTYETSVAELKKFFNIGYADAWPFIKTAMKRLASMPLEWSDGRAIHFDHWFSGASYFEGTGKIQFRINKDAEPFFLKLQSFFTCHRLGAAKKFTKAASFKLYLNLKQWENVAKWNTDLDELKARLGVAGKYTAYKNFRVRVLDPAVEEINEHSDLLVDYIPTKENRWVVGLLFRIENKMNSERKRAAEIHEANNAMGVHKKGDTEYIEPLFGQTFLDDLSKKTNGKRSEP